MSTVYLFHIKYATFLVEFIEITFCHQALSNKSLHITFIALSSSLLTNNMQLDSEFEVTNVGVNVISTKACVMYISER